MITEDYTESDSLETTVPSFVSTGEAANEVEPSYELLEHRFVNALPEDEALRVWQSCLPISVIMSVRYFYCLVVYWDDCELFSSFIYSLIKSERLTNDEEDWQTMRNAV